MEGRTDEEQVKRAEGLKGRMKRKRMSGALVAVNIKPADTPAHIHHSPPPISAHLGPFIFNQGDQMIPIFSTEQIIGGYCLKITLLLTLFCFISPVGATKQTPAHVPVILPK